MKNIQFTIICNPENRRFNYFQQAILKKGFKNAIVISYIDLLQENIDLNSILAKTDVLRIESFGENFEVYKELIALGSSNNNHFISKEQATNLVFDKGLIQHSKQLYFGFCKLLKRIEKNINKFPNIKVMNSTASIQLMFNKTACHHYLKEKSISVIPAIYNIKNFDELLFEMKKNKWQSVFIKANYTSSASGVIAFRINKNKIQATTSVKLFRKNGEIKLYNALKISTYTNLEDIKAIIDFLAKEDVIVERWVPKANTEDGFYDFRILTVAGKVKQVVVRQSKSPLTNLHLGNKRGDLEAIKTQIGFEKWKQICDLAENTAKQFPYSLYIGLDVLLSKNYNNTYIIEANAFGDLLPNVLIDGMNSYETEVDLLNI